MHRRFPDELGESQRQRGARHPRRASHRQGRSFEGNSWRGTRTSSPSRRSSPRAAPFTVQRNASLSWLSGLAGMGIVSGASGLFSLPVLLALRLESPWLLPAAWTFLGAVGLWAYQRTLPAMGRLLASRRDAFLPAVCGDDA